MADGPLRTLLGFTLIIVMGALMGLQSLAGADLAPVRAADPVPGAAAMLEALPEAEAEPALLPFAERLAAAGSVERLVSQSEAGWVPVAPGVDFQLFQVSGPNKVHVARMDRSNLGLFLETAIGQGKLTGGVERTSGQFARYDQALNYWDSTWGNTNDVLVAINGSFYNSEGVPDRGMIHSGWYAKRFSNNENGSGFVWKLDRTVFIGECVFHTPLKQVITYAPVSANTVEKFQGINISRGADQLIIYTPQFDKSTQTDASGVEVLVELERPMMVLPQPSMALGTVRQIRDLQGNTNIPFDHVVLSATGTFRTKLLANMKVGDVIGISNSITNFQDEDCATPISLDWTKAYASLGGSYYFLENNIIRTFTDPGATLRNPRTAIAYNQNYIFFIVVDGRMPGYSVGMSIAELAAFAKNTLGATYGINQDGGGSSTMVIDGQVVNTPSDLSPAPCNYAYVPLTFLGPVGQGPVGEDRENLEALQCFTHTERAVANALMIVAVQPLSKSALFSQGQAVKSTGQAAVYLGPGENYASLGSVASGTNGTVMAHSGGLNGVFAKGNHWWKVDFGGLKGWVSQAKIAPVP